MTELGRRALHFVFKIGNRRSNVNFFINILGMKVLRHEEFEEGCDAACNGPYDGKWSKTMVGYGSEDDHFVIELTYNYGIREYKRGNDFKSITIESPSVFERFGMVNYIQQTQEDGSILTRSPDGYPFVIVNKESTTKGENYPCSKHFHHFLFFYFRSGCQVVTAFFKYCQKYHLLG